MDVDKCSFNLLDEPWVQVEMLDGAIGEVGLHELFDRASSIRRIVGELPQMEFVTLRLCEAILYRAFSLPGMTEKELKALWVELWNEGAFPKEIVLAYLESVHAGFDLFGDHPFYQVDGLEYSDADPAPINVLMPDVPKADKTLFTMRSLRHSDTLRFDEAARYLLVAQAYDSAGIKSPVVGNTSINKGRVYPPKGLPGVGWCGSLGGVFLEGETLYQTLLLNFVLYDDSNAPQGLVGIPGDVAPWERDDITPDMKVCEPAGPVQMLTWQSRRLRLSVDEGCRCVDGIVLCYGDAAKPIDKQSVEMMTPWRKSEVQQKKWSLPYVPWMPRKHDPSRSLWRGLASIVSVNALESGGVEDLRPGVVRWAEGLRAKNDGVLEDSYPLTLCAQGMEYGTQDSVFADSVDDSLALNLLMLRHDGEALANTLDVISRADEAVSALVRFVQGVQVSQGDRRRYNKLGDASAGAVKRDVRERAYSELDGLFRNRIAGFGPSDDALAYCSGWMQDISRILTEISEDYLSESEISHFAGGEWGVGRLMNVFRAQLANLLGSVSTGSPEHTDGLVQE